jgi:hypothetical protein
LPDDPRKMRGLFMGGQSFVSVGPCMGSVASSCRARAEIAEHRREWLRQVRRRGGQSRADLAGTHSSEYRQLRHSLEVSRRPL